MESHSKRQGIEAQPTCSLRASRSVRRRTDAAVAKVHVWIEEVADDDFSLILDALQIRVVARWSEEGLEGVIPSYASDWPHAEVLSAERRRKAHA
ncbi:MAG: hypothetical protein ACR2PL_19880 [Dehalococcoidia bacterium]